MYRFDVFWGHPRGKMILVKYKQEYRRVFNA